MLRAFVLFLILFFISSCATTSDMEGIRLSLNPKRYKKKEDHERFNSMVAALTERNRTLEKSPEWLAQAYQGFMIKNFSELSPSEYGHYRQFMEENTVYIVVHPAFYVFFESPPVMSPKKEMTKFPEHNLVERFYARPSLLDYKFRLLQEQERLLRDFMEVVSSSRKLLILVLPGKGYKEHLSYGYTEGFDEYARYINEVTNQSDSALYILTASWDSGFLTDDDLKKFIAFLSELNPRNIIIGGGYIGRCLQNFYYQITQSYGSKGVYLAPEISAISPNDMHLQWVQGLLTSSGKINFKAAAQNLLTPNAYGVIASPPSIKGIVSYSFYPRKTQATSESPER